MSSELKIAGVLVALALAGALVCFVMRERKKRKQNDIEHGEGKIAHIEHGKEVVGRTEHKEVSTHVSHTHATSQSQKHAPGGHHHHDGKVMHDTHTQLEEQEVGIVRL